MTDSPGEAAAKAAADAEAKAAAKSKPAVAKNADGSPVLDFLTEAEAVAQAKAIGGSVVAIGVAYHVETDGDE